jgi:hypothetical protein
MFVEKYLVCPENVFWYVRKKIFGDPPRQQFWGEILMFSLHAQTRLGPYAHDRKLGAQVKIRVVAPT